MSNEQRVRGNIANILIRRFPELSEMTLSKIEQGINDATGYYINEQGKSFDWTNEYNITAKIYIQISRKIIANLENKSTKCLEKIITGEIYPSNLGHMSHRELYPELWDKIDTAVGLAYKNPDPLDREDGMFKCNKCKSQKTSYYQMQTRSADEPMTVFITCHNCYNRWRC